MAFIYRIKSSGPYAPMTGMSYRRHDGRWSILAEAEEFETREEAEKKAFAVVTKRPEWIGKVWVVRGTPS